MPKINAETPKTGFTIAGHMFQVAEPYAEGHVLTEGEADALNQTFRENVRNNLASDVTEAKKNGAIDLEALQKTIDDYANGYEFGVRGGGGGRIGDPVEQAAMEMARDMVRESIKAHPTHKLTNFKASDITEYAKQVLEKNPQIRDAAKVKVEAEQDAAKKLRESVSLPTLPA